MESPKDDCEALMSSVLPFAQQMLEKSGEFYPYGAAMRADKSIVALAFHEGQEHPQPSDLIDGLKKIIIAGGAGGEFLATALVYDVRVTMPSDNTFSDAIAVSLDHRGSYSVIVFFPYQIAKGAVVMRAPFAQKGMAAIFPSQ